MRKSINIEVTPYITITEDENGNPWSIVHGFAIDADIMDQLVAAWLLKTLDPPYTARRGYEDPQDWVVEA